MKNSIFNAVCKTRYLALLVLLIFTCRNVWGTSVTWPKTTALPGSYTNIAGDANVQIKVSSTNSYTSPIRVYASTTVSIKVASGYTIESVTYEASSTGNYVTYAQNATVTPSVTPTVSSKYVTWSYSSTTTEFTFMPANQTRSNGITVVYSSAGGGTVATPSFNNGTGTYNNNVSVTISCATDGAAIHYTTSGTAPTCSTGTTGTSVTISSTGTVLKAIACKDGSTDSEVATATYTLKCATPTGLSTDTYVGTQTVTLATATVGANIYYTTDGSNPTSGSTHYTAPFNVSSTSTIKAIAIKSNYVNSDIASATYTITPAYTVTWKNQGSNVTTTNVASGSKPVFPDMSLQSGCQTYTYFYGWAEDTWTGEVASPSTSSAVKVYKTASEMPEVDGDVTYHAVWSDTEPGWAPAASISVGDVVLLVNASGGTTYELGGISTTSTKYGLLHEYDTDPDETYPLTVGLGYNSENYSFKNGSDYLYWGSGNSLNKNTTLSTNTSWTVSINAETKVATIRNVNDASRYLQYNAGSRFACYTNSCEDPMLLKKSASGKCVTSCCNQLAAINGSVSSYTQTSVTLQWDKLSNVDGTTPYTVTCSPAGTVGSIDLSGAKATCTVTGLSCGTAYTFSITAHGTTGYCDKTQSGIAQTTSSYSVGYSVTNGSKTSGDATTCGPLTAVFSANSGYHLPDKAAITVTGASDFSWTKATGTLTITAIQITGNISISFTCPADACTDAFSLHTGTKGGGDWLYNKCFSDVDWGAADDAIWTGEFPSTNECYVGYAGGDSYHGAYWAVGGIKTYDIPNGRTLGWNGSDYYSDYPATAIGTFHIYKNSTDANYYLRFKPTTYVLRTGSDGTSWTSRDMTVSGVNANYYESEFITLTSTMISENAYVDLKANNANGHVWCNFSNSRTASGNVKVKNGASTFRATDLQAADNGSYGKFQIDITQDVDNWKLAFVPYYQVTYNANGGTGSTSASSYVEVGSTAAAASNGFTAPTGKQFSHWNTDSGDGGTSYNPAASVTLTGNVVLYAIWEDINYTVTVNQSPSVGATTTGQTSSAHYNGTINLTTTVPDGYRFVNWTTSDGFSITNNTSATTASFTMPAKNVTVTANFQQTHTVSWKSNGADYISPVTYDHGAALVLPSPDPDAPSGCSSKTFVGWTSDPEITVATSTRPTIISAGGAVNADATYRAVFADGSGDINKFKRVTSVGDIKEGGQLVFAYGTTACKLDFTGFTTFATLTISEDGNGKISTPTAAAIWNLSKSGDYWVLTNASDGTTKVATSSTSSTSVLNAETQTYYKWEIGSHSSGTNQFYLRFYGTSITSSALEYYSSDWKIWTPNSGTYASNASTALRLYVPDASYDNYITVCSSCTTPTGLAMSNITSTGGKVSWTGVSLSPSEGFKVAWNTSNSVPSPLTISNSADVDADKSEYTIPGLTPATQYYVFVQSKCNSTWSSSTNFHTNAKITYAANGGSGSMDPKEVTYNAASTTVDACTFTAPSGKTFNGWVSNVAVTVNGGGSPTTTVPAGATINNLTAAITLTAQWRDLNTWNITFNANNGTIAGGSPQVATEGSTFTFPNVTSTTCGTFIGWITSSSYSSATKPASFKAAGDTEDIPIGGSPAATTYYAVYAEETAPEPTDDYVLIENEQSDWSGEYLIVASYDDSGTPRNRAFNGSLATLDATSNYQDVTISTKTITSNSTTDSYKFTIAKVVGQPGKFSIASAGGYYIGNSGASNKLNQLSTASALTSDYYNTITWDNGIQIKGNNASPTTLTFNKTSGQTRFRYMTTNPVQITLYKKGGGSAYTYKTSPSCSPTVSTSTPASSFTYVYNAGPSASQTFQVSGSNLSTNLVVTAPSNYQVSADNSSFSNSINIAPTDGSVPTTTVYIRLVAGLNVGSYNGGVITVSSTGADNDVSGALTGSVTKAAGAIAFTDFNAVDHYEAEMPKGGTSLDVTLTVSVTGDGAVSYSRSPAAGSSAVPATTPTTTLHVTTVGTWTVTANLAAGTNYTSASTNCQVVVYYADRFYDNLHGNSTIVKRNDVGEDHYTIPSLSDESRQTSGTCSQTHYHFMGWVPEAALGSLTDDASYTAVMITSGTQAASGTNYYAVWAEE